MDASMVTDKLDNNAIAFDCSDDEFRSIGGDIASSNPIQNESKPTTEDSGMQW